MSGAFRDLTPRAALLLGLATLGACGGIAREGGSDTKGSGGSSGSCAYDGKTYGSGESFASEDGCNTCSCEDGSVACTSKDCVAGGCFHQGYYYEIGESVRSGDCNVCTCGSDGTVSCTQVSCASCDALQIAYADALADAKSCDPTQPSQCTQLIDEGLVCSCSTFANPEKAGAISQVQTLAEQYAVQQCVGNVNCEPCEEVTGGYCSPEGRCETLRNGSGAACKVGGVIYASGTSGIPDPSSCNLCACWNGELACDDAACPSSCPPDRAFGTQCAECGPNDACLVVEHTCLEVCSGSCANGGVCLNGVCKTVCG